MVGSICVLVHGLRCIMPVMFFFPYTFHSTSCLVWWFTARRDPFSCMYWWKMKTGWAGICPSGHQFWYSSRTAVALPFQNPFTNCILEYSSGEYIMFTFTTHCTLITGETSSLPATTHYTSVVIITWTHPHLNVSPAHN